MDNGLNNANYLRDELLQLFQELNRPRTNRNNSRSRINDENITEILSLLNNLITSYNDNIQEYQHNMRLIIQIIYSLLQNPRSTTNNHDTSIPRFSRMNTINSNDLENFIYYAIYPTNTVRFNGLNNLFRDNEVQRLTAEEIQTATTIFEYSVNNDNTHTSCPITLDDFQEGEQLCKILHCGHTFRNSAIQDWFRRNTRCPVCRYDIRNQSSQQQSTSQPQLPNPPNLLYNTLRDSLTNIVSDYLNSHQINTDTSNNLVYTFEFPIFSDISYNLHR